MDVSCYSFIRMLHRAEPLMRDGGACLTISYLGSKRAVSHYGIMGPVKAALEATVRYAAVELGPKGITVNALSPGPLRTRSGSGLAEFDELSARRPSACRPIICRPSTTSARTPPSSFRAAPAT